MFLSSKMAKNNTPKGKQARKSRSGPSEIGTIVTRSKLVPRLSLGADTLLGVAQSQRRVLGFVKATSISGGLGVYAEQTFLLNSPYHVDGSADAVGF